MMYPLDEAKKEITFKLKKTLMAYITEVKLEIPPEGIDLEEEVGKLEKHLLQKALQKTNGEMKRAAKLLKIPYRSIRYRLEKYGIKESRVL